MDAAELQHHYDGTRKLDPVPLWAMKREKTGYRKDEWRALVLIKNDFVCCVTGERLHPSILHAHHLWERSKFKDTEWNVLNGRPMKIDLHSEFHSHLQQRRLVATPSLLLDWMKSEGTQRQVIEGAYPGEWVGLRSAA